MHAKILTAASSYCSLHLAQRAVANEPLETPMIVRHAHNAHSAAERIIKNLYPRRSARCARAEKRKGILKGTIERSEISP